MTRVSPWTGERGGGFVIFDLLLMTKSCCLMVIFSAIRDLAPPGRIIFIRADRNIAIKMRKSFIVRNLTAQYDHGGNKLSLDQEIAMHR